MSAFVILIVIALLLAVIVIATKPTWPLLAVALILICAALLIGKP